MPRPLRVEYPGAMYHVMSRGDRREAIFEDDKDRQVFLRTLGEASAKTGWEIHAYVLMNNHFHLVLETPQPNLSVGMKWLLGTYTQRWNRRWRRWGHLFGGRYKAQCIDERSPSYLRTACDYVHLNPERARLLSPEKGLESYLWSSFPAYIRKRNRPEWLRVDRLLGEHRCEDTSAGRRQFARNLEMQCQQDPPEADLKVMRRGWRIGAEDFGDWLGRKLARRGAVTERARERRETDESLARRLIGQGLEVAGWTPEMLARAPKGDPIKVAIAREVRQFTPMTRAWIADALHMGSPSYFSALLGTTTTIK